MKRKMFNWFFFEQGSKADYESCINAARDAWRVWAEVCLL